MAENLTFRERINLLISWLKISRAEFERRAGLSNGYTRNLGGVPGAEKLEGILKAFPAVSRNWLLFGEGEMLNSKAAVEGITPEPPEKKKEVTPADPGMSARLLALVESQQQTIAQLTESNNRLARLLEGYKKVTTPAEAVGALSSAVLP